MDIQLTRYLTAQVTGMATNSVIKVKNGALRVELWHFRWKNRILVCQRDMKIYLFNKVNDVNTFINSIINKFLKNKKYILLLFKYLDSILYCPETI